MRVLKFNSVFLGIIVFAFFGSLSFSNERTEEGFKGILVPTIVLDKKGNFVEGLKKEDFEVYENGKRQELTLFALKKVFDGKVQIEALEESENFKNFLEKRTIVIIFDRLLSQPFHIDQMKYSLENFFKKFLVKNDRILIIIDDKIYAWDDEKFFASAPDPFAEITKEALMKAFYPENYSKFLINYWDFYELHMARIISSSNRDLLFNVVSSLRNIEGEKKILFLSEGYAVGPGVARIFNDSNCQVYSFDLGRLKDRNLDITQFVPAFDKQFEVGGMRVVSVVTGVEASESGISALSYKPLLTYEFFPLFDHLRLRILSEDTGGVAITSSNDLKEGLELIGKMMSKTYLLGYIPKEKAGEGKYRNIKVIVNKKGVKVLHRKGYFVKNQ